MGRYDQLGFCQETIYTPVSQLQNQIWFLMQPDTLKIGLAVYLQHLSLPSHDMPSSSRTFPLAELLAFERDEVRQGRDPFFVTATYAGKKRPVLLSLSLPGGKAAEAYGPDYVQAVNIRNDRYIKFCVKNWFRRALDLSHDLPNWGVILDNSFYSQKAYVVIDDQGQYHQAKWDKPFPQTQGEWVDAAQWGLRRIKELAPDLFLMHSTLGDPLADNSRYGEVFQAIDGTQLEPFSYEGIHEGNRSSASEDYWDRLLPPNGADAYKIQQFSCVVGDLEQTQQMFLVYLLFSGPNAFFGPSSSTDGVERPQWYAGLKNMLGSPAEAPQSIQEAGKERGYRMWSRRCEGGIVYLNLTGTRKWITLPSDGPYYDRHGERISQVVLDDCTETYVTTSRGERLTKPRINPRRPGLVTGPLTITLETGPFTPASDSKIVYTLDGSEPGEGSIVYDGPFEIHASCVVKAKSRSRRSLPSFTNFATYKLTDEDPTVEFHLASDCGSEFLEHDYPVVSLSHVSAHPVTVRYQASGGSADPESDYRLRPGTLTLQPGEQHRCFYVHIINDAESEPDETIVLSLSDPVNATLGQKTTYTYMIEDNDRDPTLEGITEDFEAGDFSRNNWLRAGDATWIVDSQVAYRGRYSARSGHITDNESTTLLSSLHSGHNRVSFYYKVSSESDRDYLRFSIDGVEQGRWSGEQNWTQCVYTIGPGTHMFSWSYAKDSSSTRGFDCAWIDNVRIFTEGQGK
jgi:hypothetical protein